MTDSTDDGGGEPDSCDAHDAREGAAAPTSGWPAESASWPSVELLAAVGDLVYTLDPTGHFTGVDGALLDATGYTREAVLGEHVSLVTDEVDLAAGNALIGDLLADPDRDHAAFERDFLAYDGTRIPCKDHVAILSTDDEFRGTIGVLCDLTDRENREEALEALHDASRTMMAAATRQDVCSVAARASKRVLGYPITVVRLLADDGHTLVPTAMTAETRARVGERPAYSIHDTPAGRAFEAGDSAVYDDIRTTDDDYEKGKARAAMYAPLGDHGVISIADTRSGIFDRADVGLANVLAANTEAALDRVAHEKRVTALHDATRRMMSVETPEEVCEVAVEAAQNTLGLRICTAWLYDDATETLRPAASSEEARALFETFPTYTAGDSLSWQAFVSGETRVYEDVSTAADRYDPDTPIRSELIVPLGEYGVLNAGSVDIGAFDVADEQVAKLLAANTETALANADREAELRRREAELRRQNARLEEFASVVSHDIRNPLNVITGNLELVRETGNLDYLDPIGRAADRVNRLTTDLLTLARHGGTVDEVEKLHLASLVADAWAVVGDESARLVLDEPLSATPTAWGTISADPARLQQLLENLLANAIEHGGPDVVIEVGPLADAEGFYLADDGPGIPPTKRERVFDHDYTTSPNGIGLGLTIVETVADAHGWRVTVTASETGGARFDVRTG